MIALIRIESELFWFSLERSPTVLIVLFQMSALPTSKAECRRGAVLQVPRGGV
jgi:hypothetical protein